ncbi:PsbP-related protein [Tenacibaculum sp. SZ-18]|uniref:PsbP-related protein n=1 Tax=Tenacibaculum sp. SZ-18 TaxID=754423 RepID=UPI0012FD4413|nr:PsbP-related protein [Tenacibaculum sp. SZ-18]
MKERLFFTFFIISIALIGQKDIDIYKGDNYFIAYPKDWELKKSNKNGIQFILYSKEQAADPFRENISLVIQNVKEGTTLESQIELVEAELRNVMKTSKVTVNTFDKIKKRHEIVYSVNISAAYLKVKQHFYLNENKLYILTFTALQKSYDDYKKRANSILDSFKFKPVSAKKWN